MSDALHLSVWIHPAEAPAAEVDACIRSLAAVHGTPAYPAHLTVVGGFDDDADAALVRFEQLAAGCSAVDVELVDVHAEAVLHRSVYVAARMSPELGHLVEAGTRIWSPTEQEQYRPHVSLQYSDLPLARKWELAESVRLALPMVVPFDRIALWCTDMRDIRTWRMLAMRPLRAAPPPTSIAAGPAPRPVGRLRNKSIADPKGEARS